MRAEWTENKLEFDFSSALQTCKPDELAEPMTQLAPPLKSMDFYVWLPKLLWFIEVKDPEGTTHPGATASVWAELKNDALLKEHLLPKLFGAYAHFVFEDADLSGPVRYSVLIGLSGLTNADRSMLTDKINRVISKIGPKLRHGRYWPQPEVHNVQSWNVAYPHVQITRHP